MAIRFGDSLGSIKGGNITATGTLLARSLEDRFGDVINVKDFGAKGDGVTDDTAAIQAAIARIRSRTNGSGWHGGAIYFPTGQYKIQDTIELSTTAAVDLRISFYGDGGYTGRGATQIIFAPSTTKHGLVLKSSQMCSFEDIEFICGNNNVDKMIYITSQNSPVFSAFMNTFRRCSFREFSGTVPTTRLITIAGGVLTEFDKCWFSGSNNTIRLGENLPSTESGGGAGQTIFKQCEIYQNIEVLNSQGLNFDTSVFGRSNLTTPVTIYPAANGFIRNDFVTFQNCSQVLNIANSAITLFTQGSNSEGLVAINNRFTGYKTVFNINGRGQALLAANWYQPPDTTPNCVAIVIASPAQDVLIGAEDFTLFVDGGFLAVDDQRTGAIRPVIVDAVLANDRAFSDIGNFEQIISTTAQIRGGLYRIRWSLTIENGADIATFTVRPTVDGNNITRACGAYQIAANRTELVTLDCVVKINATTAPVTIALTCRQNAGAAATAKADSVSFASFIQVEEVR